MSSPANTGAGYPAIATKAELDQRRENRAAPVMRPSLEPKGSDTVVMKSCTFDANERRIGYLERRLDQASNRAQTDHSFARLHGHARADFGR